MPADGRSAITAIWSSMFGEVGRRPCRPASSRCRPGPWPWQVGAVGLVDLLALGQHRIAGRWPAAVAAAGRRPRSRRSPAPPPRPRLAWIVTAAHPSGASPPRRARRCRCPTTTVAVAASRATAGPGVILAAMGFNPQRQHRRSPFDYVMVGAALAHLPGPGALGRRRLSGRSRDVLAPRSDPDGLGGRGPPGAALPGHQGLPVPRLRARHPGRDRPPGGRSHRGARPAPPLAPGVLGGPRPPSAAGVTPP